SAAGAAFAGHCRAARHRLDRRDDRSVRDQDVRRGVSAKALVDPLMRATAARSGEAPERLIRLVRVGGWLFVVGMVLAGVAAIALLGSGLGPPTPDAVLRALRTPYGLATGVLAVLGALLAVTGLALYVVVPGLDAPL